MSNTAVTLAGETLIAQRIAAGTPLVIDRIIVANVPELDPDLAVDRTEGMPDAASIVHDYAIPEEFKGYVNPNQVVYSLLLGSDIGDFSFNWLGLYASADGVMVAVTHLPATNKWQTDIATNTLGNNLTRNFMLEFSGAQDLTGITVQAATWQVDFTVRLAGIDARERQSNRDVYGRALFWGDGFKVANTGNLTLQAGIGYVEGIRAVNAALLTVSAAVTGRDVWLDVSLQGQGSDVVPIISPVVVATGAVLADYVDADNAPHYLVPLASVDGAGAVTDLRTTEAIADNVVAWLAAHPKRQDNPHNVTYAQTGAAPLNHGHGEYVTQDALVTALASLETEDPVARQRIAVLSLYRAMDQNAARFNLVNDAYDAFEDLTAVDAALSDSYGLVTGGGLENRGNGELQDGTIIGDATNAAAAFTAPDSKLAADCATGAEASGYFHIGKGWGEPRTVESFELHPSSDQGFVSGSLIYPEETYIQGSNDGSNWTTIRQVTVTEDVPYIGTLPANSYSYHRLHTNWLTSTSTPLYISRFTLFGETQGGDMTYVSTAVAALGIITEVHMLMMVDCAQVLTPGADINGYVSADNGADFTEVALQQVSTTIEGYAVFAGSAVVTAGQQVRAKVTTHNGIAVTLRGVAVQW